MNVSLLLLYLIQFGGQTAASAIHTIRQCCADNWLLIKNQSDPANNNYQCIERIESTASVGEILTDGATVQGFGISNGNDSDNNTNANLPFCKQEAKLTLLPANMANISTANACLTSINAKPAVLACAATSTTDVQQQIGMVRKCCPRNYVYHTEEKKCVPGNENYETYKSIFNHAVIILDSVLSCSTEHVLVDYYLSAEQIAYKNGQFLIKNYKRIFDSQQLCIENVILGYGKNETLTTNEKPPNEQKFLIRTCDTLDVCNNFPCLRRCCADGDIYAKGNASTYCKRDSTDIQFHSFDSLEISGNFTKPAVFGMLRGLDCLKFRLDPDSYSDESHTISAQNGLLLMSSTLKTYTNDQYCIEKIENSTGVDHKLYTFLCFDDKVVVNDRIRFKMYPVGLLISCSFYAITLLVYGCISRLRNLPGKILICLVINLFLAYLGIALGQLMPTSNDDVCFASGFFVYFCLMAAFAWMNVMCFDIWQTFGTAKKNGGLRDRQIKRFVYYSLYGWGLPTLLTVVTVTLTKSNVLSDKIRPQFGHGRCWFTYDTLGFASLIFFSGPVGILFLFNFVLFMLTLRYCNKVKKEIFRMQSSNCEKPVLRSRFFMDKARFAMNSKLCVVMGITWLLEILSIFLYDHKKTFFWTVSDSFNVLLGVFVFLIFVFKKKIWYAILEKLGFRPRSSTRRPATTCATQSTYAPHSISMSKLNAIDGNVSLLRGSSRGKNDTSVML